MNERVVLAVDLGGSQVRAALFREEGEQLGFVAESTASGDAPAIVNQVVRLARTLMHESEGAAPEALGIGVPGAPDPASGRIRHVPNVPGLDAVPLRSRLQVELGMPVALENDVNLAAVGEGWLGRARGLRDYAFLSVGTGVGLGVVAGGRLVRGAHGAAGEIAWLPLGVDPFDPGNQRRGPLEEAAGGIGIANRYEPELGADSGAREVFAAGASGDSAARALLDRQSSALALAIRAAQCVLDPALIVLGGGIGVRVDVLDRVHAQLRRLSASPVPVERSALDEKAALVGAARVALDLAGRPR